MKIPIVFKKAETDEELKEGLSILKEAVRIHTENELNKTGSSDWSKDGKTCDLSDFVKRGIHIAKELKKLNFPYLFIVRKQDAPFEIISALAVTPLSLEERTVAFSFIGTRPLYRKKGIASSLHSFVFDYFNRNYFTVKVGPEKENEAAVKCAIAGSRKSGLNARLLPNGFATEQRFPRFMI